MESQLEQILKELVIYSFNPINYDFNQLTAKERLIVGSQENLTKLASWVSNKEGKFETEELRSILFEKCFDLIEKGISVMIIGDNNSNKHQFTSRVVVASNKEKHHISVDKSNTLSSAMAINQGSLAIFKDAEKIKRYFAVSLPDFIGALISSGVQVVICTTHKWAMKQRPDFLNKFETITL
jgi:hypothetical protein